MESTLDRRQLINCQSRARRMNSFREKFGLRLTDGADSVHDEVIELLIGSNTCESITATLEGRKKRADTAETETSLPLQSTARDESRLEGIGSYDEEECIIWCADSPLSLSEDEFDRQLMKERSNTLSPLDTANVFAEADTMLGIQNHALADGGRPGTRKLRSKNSNNGRRFKGRGFFSSGILLPVGRNKSDFFSRRNDNHGSDITKLATSSAARSRKFFSVSKVPASIAEEPCSTPSSTSASVASSH